MNDKSDKSDIIVLNPGSSTIKWERFSSFNAEIASESHQAAITELETHLKELMDRNIAKIFVVRFVHGGDLFCEPTLITERNYKYLQNLNDWAPLHNTSSLLCVRFLLQRCDQCKIIAVFDTHFFRDLPLVSKSYGLPQALVERYNLRRYGFHGFSHQYMCEFWEKNNVTKNDYWIVTMQLGSGCSMALINNGVPVDTTMGFTPNEGLLMSTRSGDIDPCLVTWLQKRESWTPEQTECVLNKNSGWFGVSSLSKDFGQLLTSEDLQSRLATDLFCHRVRKTLGAYYALSGGIDGVVLSGGIAENAVKFRFDLLNNLEHLGIKLDKTLNKQANNHGLISDPNAKTRCFVVKNDESLIMLRSGQTIFSNAGS